MNTPLRPHQYGQHENDIYKPKTWEFGVDLGSTFSAGSFSLTSADTDQLYAGEIHQVSGYTHAIGDRIGITPRSEVPTQLRYEKGGIRWGYDVVDMTEKGTDKRIPGHRMYLFKPGLDDSEKTRPARRHITEALRALPFPKSVEEVVADFLTLLLTHIKSRMSLKGYDERDTVHLSITVPAMWSERAKRRTLESFNTARERSNFNFSRNISLFYEPEAATAYVFDKCRNIQWKQGDTFIVCDAGGITVDVVTYVAMGIQPLRLTEITKSQGAFCGSTYLDERFRKHVEERLKDETYLSKIPNGKPLENLIQSAVSYFEHTIKPAYKGAYETPWWVGVPNLAPNDEKGFETGEMIVTADQVEQVFTPILKETWDLIESQLKAAYKKKREPTKILCVGGLACSDRFQSHIKQMSQILAAQLGKKPISCLFPQSAEFAIAAGAILCSLNKCVVEDHISRSSIGITRHEIYQPMKSAHKNAVQEFDELEQRIYVHDCVEVLLKLDDIIPSTGHKKTSHLHQSLDIYVLDGKNFAEHYPITHPKNYGKRSPNLKSLRSDFLTKDAGCVALEKVSFDVEVAQLRERLEQLSAKKTDRPHEPLQQQRKSSRQRKKNPEVQSGCASISSGSPSTEHCSQEFENLSLTLTPPASDDPSLSDVVEEFRYLWVEYHLDVEFKDQLMNYTLFCPAADISYEGHVDLAPKLEPWNPEHSSRE